MSKRKIIIVLLFLLIGLNLVIIEAVNIENGVDLACHRRVVASSTGESENPSSSAVDGRSDTRWASVANDNEWFYVDLGSVEKVNKIVIDWEVAYASEYTISMSNDAINWTNVARVTKTEQSKDTITFDFYIETKFVRFNGISRATNHGYSFYSFEVYGPKNICTGSNISVLEVSSNENEELYNKNYMVDNDATTRWASNVSEGDNQYFIIDMGEEKTFDTIKVRWEVSFARRYAIYKYNGNDTSNIDRNDSNWVLVYKTDTGLGEVDTFNLSNYVNSRYIKVELIQRETNEETKRGGRYPWESTFSIYSFELYDWKNIKSVPLGQVMEFSKNSPAWSAMTNVCLNDSGLILAPIGYPISASGNVTNIDSIRDGDIPGFESYATYNPAVIYDEEREMFHMIYRTELPDNFTNYFGSKENLGHMSTLSYAYSYDGVNYIRGKNNPIAWSTSNDSVGGGLEDPRVCRVINDPNRGGKTTYYITFTMYDNNITREGVIITEDFVNFTKEQRLAPDYNGAIKSGSYVCDPSGNAVLINDPRPGKTGKVYMIYMKDGGYCKIGFTTDCMRINSDDIVDVAYSGLSNNNIEALTSGNESCMALTNLYGENDEDIYLMYGGGLRNRQLELFPNSINNGHNGERGWFYALGVLKTTKSNPFELSYQTLDLDEPMMYPTDTNKIDYGLFRKCMFADTMIRKDDKWYFYYGAGDMYVGLATANGSFTAGSSEYVLNDNVLTASTYALNKKYGDDKTSWNIKYVAIVYDINGRVLKEVEMSYEVLHFSHLANGKYSNGQLVNVEVDLSSIEGLPSEYYVETYIKDTNTNEVLNNKSYYTVISGSITSKVER